MYRGVGVGYKNLIIKRLILCVLPLIFVHIYMTHPLFGTGNYNAPLVYLKIFMTQPYCDLKNSWPYWPSPQFPPPKKKQLYDQSLAFQFIE